MSEYSKLARRVESIKKSIEETKVTKPVAEEENKEVYDKLLHMELSNIGHLISMNVRKDITNKEKDVLDEDLGFPNYINVINSFRNPDILTGNALKVLKGNKYRAKMANRNEEEQQGDDKHDIKAEKEEGEEVEKSAGEEPTDEPDIPSRYFHQESKAIRCRNCKEIGHMARNCPNESKIPLCKFCGTQHGIEELCPSIKCFKCNKSGHKVGDCRATDITICSKCKSIGHTESRCLLTTFNGKNKRVLCVVCHKPGHLNCQNVHREDFHIDFVEEEVEDSDDDNLFASYTIKDLEKDEKDWRRLKARERDDDIDSYDEHEGIGTNLVNTKQLKKLRKQAYREDSYNKRLKKFYTFPVEDEDCTESQLHTKYCGNCGRKGHHFNDCKYEDNPLYLNYQRKTYRRDKINKEEINRKDSMRRNLSKSSGHRSRKDSHSDRHDCKCFPL
jgi:hypothetical protein